MIILTGKNRREQNFFHKNSVHMQANPPLLSIKIARNKMEDVYQYFCSFSMKSRSKRNPYKKYIICANACMYTISCRDAGRDCDCIIEGERKQKF